MVLPSTQSLKPESLRAPNLSSWPLRWVPSPLRPLLNPNAAMLAFCPRPLDSSHVTQNNSQTLPSPAGVWDRSNRITDACFWPSRCTCKGHRVLSPGSGCDASPHLERPPRFVGVQPFLIHRTSVFTSHSLEVFASSVLPYSPPTPSSFLNLLVASYCVSSCTVSLARQRTLCAGRAWPVRLTVGLQSLAPCLLAAGRMNERCRRNGTTSKHQGDRALQRDARGVSACVSMSSAP